MELLFTMARRIRVSRHGLTCCPACQAHIQIAANVRETACPFCQAALIATPEPAAGTLTGLIQGALATGRSGLLAASLLGLSVGVGACADEEDPEPTTDTQSADGTSGTSDTNVTTTPDSTMGDLYGLPPDTTPDPDVVTVEDTNAVAEYGIPPDIIEDAAEEDVPAADYGLPADANP